MVLRGIHYFLSQENIVIAVILIDFASLELFLKRNPAFLRRTIIQDVTPLNLHGLSNDPLSNHLSFGRQVTLFGEFMPLLKEEDDALPDGQAYCVVIALIFRVYE